MKKTAASKSGSHRWLFKSEPSAFGILDLKNAKRQTAPWDGVRNYQARNFLRDEVQVGDQVFFYHSREEPLGIFGIMEVVKAGHPDVTAFDPKSKYYDASSKPESPRWIAVEVKLVKIFSQPVTREMLAADRVTSEMLVMQRGMRLSIQPVTAEEWKAVLRLAESS